VLTEEKDLETEIVESEEAISSISLHITQVKYLLNKGKPPPKDTAAGAVAPQDSGIRLPRLNIPSFTGDALSWEPF